MTLIWDWNIPVGNAIRVRSAAVKVLFTPSSCHTYRVVLRMELDQRDNAPIGHHGEVNTSYYEVRMRLHHSYRQAVVV